MASLDERRDVLVLEDAEEAIVWAANNFLETAKRAIAERGQFLVALSGGHTPKAIFEQLLKSPQEVNWGAVKLFWGDERAVPPDHPDSNYKMAMEAAFSKLPVKPENIFRMPADSDLKEGALRYERLLQTHGTALDLVMLGMGDDGHTASLFPHTDALDISHCLVTPNWVPQKNSWRMTLTYEGIHRSRAIIFYVLGANKADKVKEVLKGPYDYQNLPSQKVGTTQVKSLWLMDKAAAAYIL